MIDNPLEILDIEWENLENAVLSAKHSFHSFTLSTIRKNIPQARTIILQAFDKSSFSISFNTDSRSKKLIDIHENKYVSALFYDKKRRTQLRVSGEAIILAKTDKSVIKIWESMNPESKLCYMGPFSPSTALESFQLNTINKSAYEININDDRLGYSHFCRVVIKIKKIDWLFLNHKGHRRLEFNFNETVGFNWIAV